jgi:hypothetical protein
LPRNLRKISTITWTHENSLEDIDFDTYVYLITFISKPIIKNYDAFEDDKCNMCKNNYPSTTNKLESNEFQIFIHK